MASKRLADMSTNVWSQALDDNINLFTRLSGYREINFVLCCEDSNKVMRLLDGSIVSFAQKNTQLNYAKALHRNTIKIPEWYFATVKEDKRFKKYFIEDRILVEEDKTDVQGLKNGYCVIWDADLGLLVQKESA